jgi:hypothetical protein
MAVMPATVRASWISIAVLVPATVSSVAGAVRNGVRDDEGDVRSRMRISTTVAAIRRGRVP